MTPEDPEVTMARFKAQRMADAAANDEAQKNVWRLVTDLQKFRLAPSDKSIRAIAYLRRSIDRYLFEVKVSLDNMAERFGEEAVQKTRDIVDKALQ